MRKTLIVIASCLVIADASAQGCSDAGFCSLGALKNVSFTTSKKNTLDLGSAVGFGEQQTFTITPYVQYTRQLSKQFSLTGKLTATYANGFLGNAFDAGDLYGVGTYTSGSVRFLAGFKLPLTSANTKNAQGKPLPLDYQSSIGTYDLIAGVNYIINKKFELDAGIQVPVIQSNKNTFFPDEYTDTRANKFSPTNQFSRKSDALIRVGYYIPLSSSVMIKPNLLGIYHFGEDTYENRFGMRTAIKNSGGLTLNGAFVLTKQFANGNHLELVAATPFIVREVRPDGLTREAVISIQYSISF